MPITLKGTLKPGQPDRRYYMIRVQVEGRREVLSSGTRDKKLAEAKERDVVDAIRADHSIPKEELVALVRGARSLAALAATRKGSGLTLRGAFDRCLSDLTVWGRIKAHAEYRRNCADIAKFMGENTPVAAVDRPLIKKYVNSLLDSGLQNATINRRLACLRRMFNVAMEEEWEDAPKAFPKVKALKEPEGRTFRFSLEQEAEVLAAVLDLDNVLPGTKGGPPRKRDAHRYHKLYLTLVESGMRLGEALGLRWVEVVLPPGSDGGMIELFRPEALKTGKPRSIPITPTCRAALEACKGVRGGPFADLNERRAQDIWSRAVSAARIDNKDAVIHALRHTCASRLLDVTNNMKVVKEWLGHSDIKTTDIYTHLATHQLTSVAKDLAGARGTQPDSTQPSRDREA